MKGFRSYSPNYQHRPLLHEPFTRWFFRQGHNTKIGCVVLLLGCWFFVVGAEL